MRYRNLTGYDAIIGLEAEKALQSFLEQFEHLNEKTEFEVYDTVNPGKVHYQEGMTVGDLLNAAGGVPEGKTLKAVHIGYPVGGVFTPDVLDRPLSVDLFKDADLCPGSMEVHLLFKEDCMADYLRRLSLILQEESCGRCVYCREGLRQARVITKDITDNKGQSSDIELIDDMMDALHTAGQCLYGRSAGAEILDYMNKFGDEVKAHIDSKKCPADFCKMFKTYHILGSKCKGCTKCLDVCEAEAIEGEKGYIHVIDNYSCTRCGKCLDVCPYHAIVVAGAVKPRTPEEPIRVGTWRGR